MTSTYTLSPTARAAILDLRAVCNCHTPEEVIAEADRANPTGAGELLSREALMHEACGNQRTADLFWKAVEAL